MKNKWLHTFVINRDIEKKVTEKTTNEDGEEVETTRTTKESAPATFHLKKPNRKLYDKAELFYGVRMSEGIKAGLLTRNLLAKRYEDDGGAFSEAEKERYSELYMEIYNKENEYQRLQVNLDNKSQDLKDSISDTLLSELAELRRELVEIENSQANIFDQTAENRAKNQTIMWWVLNVSQWTEHEGMDPKPFFKGKNYEERLDTYDEFEDSDDDFFNEAIRKLAFFVSFWYMGRANSGEEFKAVEDLYETQNPSDEVDEGEDAGATDEVEQEKEAPSKAKKKKAKKKSKVEKKTEEKAEEKVEKKTEERAEEETEEKAREGALQKAVEENIEENKTAKAEDSPIAPEETSNKEASTEGETNE
jgi:hypothetical protein